MKEEFIVKILSIERLTHDVKRFCVEKPPGYAFIPGQATEVTINKEGWLGKRNPFTFTSLNAWKYLEFIIKIYDERRDVTHQLDLLKTGDELILHDVWGTIQYEGEGCFIAAGAGITPFIAILRQLYKDGIIENNKLFFSNKTVADIIQKNEFTKMLGKNFFNTITQQKVAGYDQCLIDESYLKEHIRDFNQHFYICGPDPMVQSVQKALKHLGARRKAIVVEM